MIRLFVSSRVPNCPGCMSARKYLQMNNFRYEEVDIAKNRDEANAMYKKSKSLMIPQLDIGGEIVIGWSNRMVAKAINKVIENSSK